ncbi:response regulator transcription factor [Candidatus Saccharibacteria bacterium]|nr:response regulator transcription factor [Candidatus Saccharibacteria bacterium]
MPVATKPHRVLCIEDEFFIGELYERALRKAGYEVTTVLNGTDGLQVAQTNRYDIVLLDLMVPGLTGIEILRSLRNPDISPGFKSKVIITTNLDQDDETKTEIEEQADGYIIKASITPKELVSFIDKLEL